MQTLRLTIEKHQLPAEPFYRLIEANRRDQHVASYTSFNELLDYCSYSANPVGRLVLALLGLTNETNVLLSDATCTALQLTNFWQDVAIDLDKDRVYIPIDDMNSTGYSLEMLHNHEINVAWIHLIRLQLKRTREFFKTGEQLLHLIPGRLRMEIGLFSMGGLKILDKIEENQYDVFSKRLTISKQQKIRLFWRALFHYPPWKRGI